eukprot:TRINITY_DN36303_c0_g1_i2.p1 TRINITY_DN36303_c0_g1~~TRINITY_DN36303_c0_g1_i2.p1  ORF type:complete len:378 (-),score=56.24 TRINITY_DN36303_c0_g1_i2:231-1310(-)
MLAWPHLKRRPGCLNTASVTNAMFNQCSAGSAILNSLLTILNERKFDTGCGRMDVDLVCVVAASNKLPESDDVRALFDRFLLRRHVDPISDEAVPEYLRAALTPLPDTAGEGCTQTTPGLAEDARLRAADLHRCQLEAVDTVVFPDGMLHLLVALRRHLSERMDPPVFLSDRRLGKAVKFLRVAAYAAGVCVVEETHLLLLQHVFWEQHPKQGEEVRDWLLRHIGCVTATVTLSRLQALVDCARRQLDDPSFLREGMMELERLEDELSNQLRERLSLWTRLTSQLQRLHHERGFLVHALFPKGAPQEVAKTMLSRLKAKISQTEKVLQQVWELKAAAKLLDDALRRGCLEYVALKHGRS